LHGLGCRTTIWDRFAEHAGGALELWDVELPWHGADDTAWSHREDSVQLLVDAVPAGFDALIAHSFSANLVVEAFATRRIRACPTVLANAFYRPSARDFTWATIARYLNDFHLIFAEALRDGDTAHLSEKHRRWMSESLRDQIGPYGWTRFFESYLRSPQLDLTTVPAPILVLTGEHDIATRVPDGRALAAGLPHGRFEAIAECGHFPMLQQPERFAGSVTSFFETTATRLATDDHAWS
jgi:pimeloyl-ACP methyl ester carboxylesterase